MPMAIIFDFDGVIADSEVLANTVLAECVTELGVPMTLDDSYRTFMGKRFEDVIGTIENLLGRRVPQDFADDFQRRTLSSFRQSLRPIAGVREFIGEFLDLSRCIASSSSPDRLALCLDVVDLTGFFEGRVFSASLVARGKPHPDIFLHAAAAIGVQPQACIVIEDSVGGVRAGRAAGATVIGFLAGGHIRQGHEAALGEAGAQHLAHSWADAAEIVRVLRG